YLLHAFVLTSTLRPLRLSLFPYTTLFRSFRGFIPFAICFTMLLTVWYAHYVFFRRYGLDDQLTIFLNSVLLFVVLFYVYPLKFLDRNSTRLNSSHGRISYAVFCLTKKLSA